MIENKWSGRVDLNHRPPGPEPGALARLRYAPNLQNIAAQFTWDRPERQLDINWPILGRVSRPGPLDFFPAMPSLRMEQWSSAKHRNSFMMHLNNESKEVSLCRAEGASAE